MSTSEASSTSVTTAPVETTKFPTVGLKSLLQNSDLLEILLKPLGKSSSSSSSSTIEEGGEYIVSPVPSPISSSSMPLTPSRPQVSPPSFSPGSSNSFNTNSETTNLPQDANTAPIGDILNMDLLDKLEPKPLKSGIVANPAEGDILELLSGKSPNGDVEINPAKIYGNPFLGPNLWDKNDLFQGGVQFEHLEMDEFLNENGLSETDMQFLDQIQKLETLNSLPSLNTPSSTTTTTTTTTTSNPTTTTTALLTPAIATQPVIVSAPVNAEIMPSTSAALSKVVPLSKEPIVANIGAKSKNSVVSSTARQTSEKARSRSATTTTKTTTPAIVATNRPKTRQQSQQRAARKQSIENSSDAEEIAESRSRKRQKPVIDDDDETSDSSSRDESRDLSSDANSSDEYEYDPKRRISTDDLRPQPLMRKSKKQFVPNEMKDEKYWQRRRKNNIAAKRSRDARRMKENQIAIRASYLERENDALRKQLEEFKRESKSLKQRVAKYEAMYPDLVGHAD